jgi:diguanylate cyclase (GGDEF)-like protein
VASVSAIVFSPDGSPSPEALLRWLAALDFRVVRTGDPKDVMTEALRSRPGLIIFDARSAASASEDACRLLKADSYTGIIPAVVLAAEGAAALANAFEAGADEVTQPGMAEAEQRLRLNAMLRRSERDTRVHPSTRLPGSVEIEAALTRRLEARELFACCYADLDHFKEFNDRYGYYEGDRVIRMVARILHDVVKGTTGTEGFVGHIGGDDFLFIIPLEHVQSVCSDIISTFDSLAPYQYSEQDRRATYFFGKDRRGQLHRVPLMTLSIGVVTNERRHFTHASQISELATEMKTYAKTLTGSIFSIDRRQDPLSPDAEAPVDRPVERAVTEEK